MNNLFYYKAKVIKVVDGDTCDVCIDLGFDIHVKQRIRFYGIDTPETRTRDKEEKARGLKAKQFVKDLIEDKEVELKVYKQGKFGRYLVDVFIDGKNLNKLLIKEGYSSEYFGGQR